ncbi:MAG: class I SAM-dependent methyltransferase [Acidimicrobiia bacterium]
MEPQEQAGVLLGDAAGYIATRTIRIGLDRGLFELIGETGPIGSADLAEAGGLDKLYSEVWCRSAFAAGVLEGHDEDAYTLAPHIEVLLLDQSSPAYVGGLFKVLTEPEVFDTFTENFESGERIWWDQTSPAWIAAVGETGGAFNTRFIPGGISQVPGAADRLAAGTKALELACGTGVGLVRLGTEFPNLDLVGLDGDAHSLRSAGSRIDDAGIAGRVHLIHSGMEDLDAEEEFDAITINVSMHECRDVEKVTGAVHRALKPGGYFLNSDFPFPETGDGVKTVPGRIMSGIQFFEALIDDQLLSVNYYLDLYDRHGFTEKGVVEVTPLHAITWARK